MTRLRRVSLLVSLVIGAARLAAAQAPAATAATPHQTVYVQDFQARRPEGAASGKRLSQLRETKAQQKTWQSAGSLSSAIAAEFQAAGYTSQRIAADAPLPKSGWLVSGVFYALESKGKGIQKPSFLSSGTPAPNTQVSVSVADLAVDPSSPFIVFGTAEALRGQGTAAGWNPYVVAAKFVVNKVESSADIQRFAKEIVDTILQNKSAIQAQAPSPSR